VDLPDKIGGLARAVQARADQTDVAQFGQTLSAVTKRKDELEASIRLSKVKAQLMAEVARLKRARALAIARNATDTSGITQKSSALTRQYATQQILDRFTRETERLNLQRVTLRDLGGQKGQLAQQPGLLGAKNKAASAQAVLSEGEQTALGLAGFITEAYFDQSKSAVIFDDPVTSLDHVRRDKVAERLAQLAQDRQVVVFTHDVAFTGDLVAAADSVGVALTTRAVERLGSRPGLVVDTFPWKAKDFNARVHEMQTELGKIKKDRPTLSSTQYELRVAAWAGMLSETWERCAITEIMNQVFDRGTSQVRVLKFRLLALITEDDNQDYQDGYGHTSKWAKRHDKAPDINYVAPELEELESELERIKSWQKRIKNYL
jgi:energy-coupling factor transporter ATP-binding protein EcfA2